MPEWHGDLDQCFQFCRLLSASQGILDNCLATVTSCLLHQRAVGLQLLSALQLLQLSGDRIAKPASLAAGGLQGILANVVDLAALQDWAGSIEQQHPHTFNMTVLGRSHDWSVLEPVPLLRVPTHLVVNLMVLGTIVQQKIGVVQEAFADALFHD